METQTANLSPEMLAVISAVIGFIIGAIIFYLIGKRSGLSPENNPLQKPYDALKQEFATYRKNVNSHFARTADAVDNLTKSYQEVFTHLSDGAEKLMDKEALQAEIQKRQGKAVTLAYLTGQATNTPNQTKNIAASSIVNEQKVEAAKSGAAPVAPRPAAAAKPATEPKSTLTPPEAKKEPQKDSQDKPAEVKSAPANTPNTTLSEALKNKNATVDTSPHTSASTLEQSAEKTNAMKAAEKAGLTPVEGKKATTDDGLEAVKRHIRENQPK